MKIRTHHTWGEEGNINPFFPVFSFNTSEIIRNPFLMISGSSEMEHRQEMGLTNNNKQ